LQASAFHECNVRRYVADLYAEQGFFNQYVANLTAREGPGAFADLHRRYDSCGMNDLQADFEVAVHHPCAFIRRWKPGAVRLREVSTPAELVPADGGESRADVPYMLDPHIPSQVWAWEPAAREVMAVDRPAFDMQRIFSTVYAEANACFTHPSEATCAAAGADSGCAWCLGR
jgi:hypothetical protein